MAFTNEQRRVHQLCSVCVRRSRCRFVPRSSTACDAFVQRKRDQREHGSKTSYDKWEVR